MVVLFGPMKSALAVLLCHVVISQAIISAALQPRFSVWRTFAALPDATLRDPSTALFDPSSRTWHVYCTHVPKSANTTAGYPGSIWHWSLNSTDNFDPSVSWKSEGSVLSASSTKSGAFDASGVFTPGAARECEDDGTRCTYYLWFGGVADQSSAHTEAIGLAVSKDGPWGPFRRVSSNAVIDRAGVRAWCGEDGGEVGARVDEIKPAVVDGLRYIIVKSVCSNFTALPVVFALDSSQGGWGPPYTQVGDGPMFLANESCVSEGFEEPTLVRAPDGLLHFFGHNHGASCVPYAHFVRRSNASSLFPRSEWTKLPDFGSDSTFLEPVPVPTKGDGVFGEVDIFQDHWIDFFAGDGGALHLAFNNVTWEAAPN